MAGSFTVSPEALDRAAFAFDSASQDMAAGLGRLRAALPDPRRMCGDDDSGRKFAGEYGQQAGQLQGILDQMVTGLEGVAGALRSMAANYGGADQASTMRTTGG